MALQPPFPLHRRNAASEQQFVADPQWQQRDGCLMFRLQLVARLRFRLAGLAEDGHVKDLLLELAP